MAHSYYRQRGGEDEAFDRQAALLESHGVRVERFTAANAELEALSAYTQAARTLWNRDTVARMAGAIAAFHPDVVHLHNSFPALSPSIIHAAKAQGIPVVMTMHNYRMACANGLFFRDGKPCEQCMHKGFAWPALRRRCYRGSMAASAVGAGVIGLHRQRGTWELVDRFIAPSRFAAVRLEAMGVAHDRIRVIPHAVTGDAPPERKRHGLFYAGRLSEEKGLRTLLQAMARLDESHHLTIAGDGPLAELVSQAAKVDTRIRWLGRLSTEAVRAEMHRAIAVVVPSHCYETFGLTAAEAYATATPVIGSALGAIGEIVKEGITGLHFETGNPVDLAEKIRWALAHEPEMHAMGCAARAHYERNFTSGAHIRALRELYGEVTGHATRQAA